MATYLSGVVQKVAAERQERGTAGVRLQSGGTRRLLTLQCCLERVWRVSANAVNLKCKFLTALEKGGCACNRRDDAECKGWHPTLYWEDFKFQTKPNNNNMRLHKG